ncbi:MAG: ABC transporter ATP-binding protein [Thermodesulfobacteriota bacterium]|nr:ABC transporter ATP-binding protein [Thermodesulfobacteriota bacterium]
MTNPISFKTLSKAFPCGLIKKYRVLNRISLDIQEGEVFGFLGPNGAGKSTAINIAMGFAIPDEGNVFINDIPAFLPRAREFVGYLPEHPTLYEQLSAAELLEFVGAASGIAKRAVKDRTDRLLDRLNLLSFKNRPVRTYSKGMKQRLGFAMAMIADPPVLILDEPMSGLDPMGRNLIANIILDLKSRGKTIFFSTHILNDVEKLCDHIAVIHQGEILFNGTISQFTATPDNENLEAAFVSLINTSRVKEQP